MFLLSPEPVVRAAAPAHSRRASAARARGARPDLREVRPGRSTRRDLLPTDIADELAKLQDRVPPFSGAVARRASSARTASPSREVFAEFERDAARRGVDRAGARREAAGRQGSRRQGAAPGHARGDRARSRSAVRAGRPRATLLARSRAGCGRVEIVARVREDDPRRARPDARSGECRAAEAQLRGLAAAVRARGVLGLLPRRT